MGVFLVVVISAALLVFRPGAAAPETSMSYRQINGERSATTDPAELIRDDSFRGLQNPDSVSPIYSSNGESAEQAGETARVISVPKPTAAAVPAKPAAVAPAAKPKAPAPAPKPEAASTVAAASRQRYRDFWVQAGSFSTRERADGVKHNLDDKGISAVITNQDINGNTYYRVRVGPYTSQNEADYWLAMIKSIDGFQDSQIWESQSLR